jgi:hypothetical protein
MIISVDVYFSYQYEKVRVFFFQKVDILISRRYQLYPVSATTQYFNSITDAHSQKKKEEL